jgi:hypothetical protein
MKKEEVKDHVIAAFCTVWIIAGLLIIFLSCTLL